MDELLAEFVSEATGSLSQLEEALLAFERLPGNEAALSLLFRLIHTTKGTCGFLGLTRLERLAHAAEDVLGVVRDGTILVTPVVVDGVSATVREFREIIIALAATGAEPPGNEDALIAHLSALAAGEAADGRTPLPATQPCSTSPAILCGQTRLTPALQTGAARSRRQPVGQAWKRLPRLVRALARDLGKSIELVTEGAETGLDRHTLEQIAGPLTHMVRNSADHGLEPPAERLARGKRPVGTITVTAADAGGHVVITVSDDGRGLAAERIRATAIAQGLACAREIAAMDNSAIARFIFRPGFSTAAAVTSVSGRGVGMDVVKTSIERIGGKIEVASAEGRGTSFRMTLPSSSQGTSPWF